MKKRKIKRCISCGICTVILSEFLICHECVEKIHKTPHLNGIGIGYKQLGLPTYSESITASPSPSPED